MELIKLTDIGKIYAQEHIATVGIHKVNLTFRMGEFVAVTGASGSGKSTLLNIISGMDTFDEGELYIEGYPTSHYTEEEWADFRNKYISVVFQNYSIIESMTVLENVELALMHIDSRQERTQRATHFIAQVGLEKEKCKKASQLSGGQKQRVGIARALAKDTPILLADEPTGNLDPETSGEIMKLLHSVSEGKLVIVVTHNFDEIEQYATRKIVVDDNQIIGDQVLKTVPNTMKTATVDCSDKGHSNIITKGIKIGMMLHRAMSGMSLFYTIVILFATLVLAFFFGITGKRLKSGLLMDWHLFQPSEGRVVVVRSDGSPISGAEVQSLADTSHADSYLHNDYLLDVHSINEWNRFLQLPEMYDDEDQDYPFWIVSDLSFGTLSVGRYPQEPSECVLSIPYSLASVFGRDFIRIDKIYQFGLELRVTGIHYYEDNNRMGQLLVKSETYEILSLLAYYNQSLKCNIQLNNPDIDNASLLDIKIRYSFDAEEDEARIRVRELLQLDNQIADLSVKLYITDPKEYSDTVIGIVKEFSNQVVFDKTLSKTENLILLNPRSIQKEMSDRITQTYGQCSLFFNDPVFKKQAIRDLNKSGFIAVSSDEEYYPSDSNLIGGIMESVVLIGILIAVTLIVILILVFSTGKIVASCEKEIGIMQAFGIEATAIRGSMATRTILSCIPSWIGMVLLGLFGYRNETINKMMLYLYIQYYLAFGILVLVVVIYNIQKRTDRVLSKSVTAKLRELT